MYNRLPPVKKCECCGEEFYLTNALTNECPECGALYNLFGQRLQDGVDRLDHPCHDGKIF